MSGVQLISISNQQVTRLTVQGGEQLTAEGLSSFQLVDAATGHPIKVEERQQGDNLELWQDGKKLLEIEGYYTDGSDAQYVADQALLDTIADTAAAESLPDMGSQNNGQTNVEGDAGESELSSWTSGLATVAAGSLAGLSYYRRHDDEGGSDDLSVTVTPMAGPFISDVLVTLYDAAGNELGNGSVDETTGEVVINVPDGYSGAMLVVVTDINGDEADYISEATGEETSLNGSLRAMINVGGSGSTSLSVTPLTELAAQLAGVPDDVSELAESPLSDDQVDTNEAIAELFGLTDILGAATSVAEDDFDGSDGMSDAEKYGDILAILSGSEENLGGLAASVAALAAQITLSDSGEAELSSEGASILQSGLQTFEEGIYADRLDSQSTIASMPVINEGQSGLTQQEAADGTVVKVEGVVVGDTVNLTLGALTIEYLVTEDMLDGDTASLVVTAEELQTAGEGNQELVVQVNEEEPQQSVEIYLDLTPPAVEISLASTALKVGETTVVTFTFSEEIKGFDLDSILADSGSISDLVASDDGLTWTATYTPNEDTENAAASISVLPTFTDSVGNLPESFTPEGSDTAVSAQATLAVDTLTPEVDIEYSDNLVVDTNASVLESSISGGAEYLHALLPLGDEQFAVISESPVYDTVLFQLVDSQGLPLGDKVELETPEDYWFDEGYMLSVSSLGQFSIAYVAEVEFEIDVDGETRSTTIETPVINTYNSSGELINSVALGLELSTELGDDLAYQWSYDVSFAEVGSDGDFVVSWSGDNDDSGLVYVQRFDSTGAAVGETIALGSGTVWNWSSDVAVVGADGSYIVSWTGEDEPTGLDNVYLQRFAADGTALGGVFTAPSVTVDGVSYDYNYNQDVVAVGSDGNFALVWQSNGGYVSALLFDASGSVLSETVTLTIPGKTYNYIDDLAVTEVGTDGGYVMTWAGYGSGYAYDVCVQLFDATGSAVGDLVVLNAPDVERGSDRDIQVLALAEDGAYIVLWRGQDSDGDYSNFAQVFNADGSARGETIQMEFPGEDEAYDYQPHIVAVSESGEFLVAWSGYAADGDLKVVIQPFNADGTMAGEYYDYVQPGTDVELTASEAGILYLVSDSVVVSAVADITAADASLWSSAESSEDDLTVALNTEALSDGTYFAYMVDSAGNLSLVSAQSIILDGTAPVISSGDEATAVSEAQPPVDPVYVVAVDDAQATVTLAGEDADYLWLNEETGAVYLTVIPNYETKSSYSFDVVATDFAGNETVQSVTLAVNDVDEVAPVFTSSTTADAIDENSGAGSVVYTAVVDDSADVSDGVTLSFSGTDASAFSFNADSGEVTLLADADYEEQSSYSFVITATDAAGNTSSQTVTLAVSDLDEVAPEVTLSDTPAASDSDSVNVLFDFVNGTSTLDSDGDRVFDADTTYVIYMQLDSDSTSLSMAINQKWSGVANLGSDDLIVLVGNDDSEEGILGREGTGPIDSFTRYSYPDAYTYISWQDGSYSTVYIRDVGYGGTGSYIGHYYNGSQGIAYWATDNGDLLLGNQTADLSDIYYSTLPDGVTFITSLDDIDDGSGDGSDSGSNEPAVPYITSSEASTLYLVSASIAVSELTDITSADSSLWTSATAEEAGVSMAMDTDSLTDGEYLAYAVDAAGNLSLASESSFTVSGNPPVFTSGEDATSVTENSGAGTVVYTASTNVASTFSLSGEDAEYFSLDGETGEVTLLADTDFEAKASYSFDIVAVDEQGDSSTQTVTLAVTNQDESAPVFPQMIETQTLNDTLTVSYTVVEIEVELVAGVTYYIDQYGSSTGDGSMAYPWVREMTDPSGNSVYLTTRASAYSSGYSRVEYTPTVSGTYTVKAGGNSDSKGSFTLVVTPISEGINTNFVEVDENISADSVIYTADATDTADIGDSTDTTSELTYSLSGDDSVFFTLDENTGELRFAASPDFEAQSSYQPVVVATDAAGNSASQTIYVTLNNLDEAAPVFTSEAEISIDEDVELGDWVYYAEVDDSTDTSEGVTFSLSGADAELFEIDSEWGDVYTNTEFDYETRSSYSIDVVATDAAGNSSTQTVTVTINNVDEVAPVFISGGEAMSVDENSGAGTVVYTATVDDSGDISEGVSLSLRGQDSGYFSLDRTTGEVTLRSNVNYEAKSSYEFTIRAYDENGNYTDQTVTMAVNNLDDTAPVFKSGSEATIDENSGADTVVYTAIVDDSTDVSDGVTLTFSSADADYFSFNADTGEVTPLADADFETKDSYEFDITATDAAGNATVQTVMLAVNNLDESAPTFTPVEALEVAERTSTDTVIYTAAVDDSADIESGMTFSLTGADAEAFTIDAETGELRFVASPNYDEQTRYSVTVGATDGAGNSSTQALSVAITDVEDLPPVFSSATQASVAENSAVGTQVYTAVATDDSAVTYSLAGTHADAFDIDADTGVVTLLVSPDYETQSSYSFDVVATDAANNSAFQTITLAVTDVDEVPPAFTSSSEAVAIDENSGAGSVIYTATTDDASAVLSFGGFDADYFSFDAATGEVTLLADADFEAKASYKFDIIATDAAGNATVQTVTLAVNNLDEVAPEFLSGSETVAIDENTGAGAVVYIAQVQDSGDISAGVTLSLSGNDAEYFSLNAYTGEVSLLADADHEAKAEYQFDIIATDAADNASVQTLTVALNDLDDSAPELMVTTASKTGFIVTWSSFTQVASDSYYDVYAQRYDADGNTLGSEFLVNSTTVAGQRDSSVTYLSDGGFVIVWRAWVNEDWDIAGQRFDADANPVGDEFAINTYTTGAQSYPTVEALADGGFIVAWASDDQDGSSVGVFAQQFDANGELVGGEFQVNSNTNDVQSNAAIAGLNGGDYVIVWSSKDIDGSDWGISAQRYDADGNTIGSEIRVNTTTSGYQSFADVAALDDGGYMVTWHADGQDGSVWGIYSQRYDADGNAVGGETRVNSTISGYQGYPDITGLTDGGYVITWRSYSSYGGGSNETIYGQRFDADGNAVGDEFQVAFISSYATEVSTTSLVDGGFVITWEQAGSVDGSGYGVFGQRYDADGNAVGDSFQVNTYTTGDQRYVDVATVRGSALVVDDEGNVSIDENTGAGEVIYIVSATDTADVDDATDTSAGVTLTLEGEDAALFRFDASTGEISLLADADYETRSSYSLELVATDAAGNETRETLTLNVNNFDDTAPVFTSETVADAIDEKTGGGTVVYTAVADDSADVSGGVVYILSGTDAALFSLDAETGAVTLLADADHESQSSYEFVVTATDAAGNSSSQTVTLAVNDLDESAPEFTTTANGYVVTWHSANQDGSGYGVYAQMYDTDGNTIGSEIQVNTYTSNTQAWPGVSYLTNGGFVVTWASGGQDGSYDGIYMQLFDADGNKVGSETLVNTTTSSDQDRPEITSLADGGFVVTWISDQGGSYDIYAQRYDVDGSAVGSEFLVNTYTANDQTVPSVAALSDGGFVVSWQSYGQAGSYNEVYVQRYDADGNPVGTEQRVNTSTTDNQVNAEIAGLAGGGFVVVWQDPTGTGWDIYAQRYDADGNALGSNLVVNTYVADRQFNPTITALSNGGFVVAWNSDNLDGSGTSIQGQLFDADGNTVGSAFLINSYSTGDQITATITALDDGGFVVSWESPDQDGSGTGVYGQRFDSSANAVGDEFQVNSYTTGDQAGAAVSSLLNSLTVDENLSTDTVIFTAQASDTADADDDTDASAELTYSLAGTDAEAFSIDAETGEVRFAARPDYETQSSYEIDIVVTDTGGNSSTQALSVSVNDLDESGTKVLIDFVNGVSSLDADGDRTFDADTTYTIYMLVDSDSLDMNMAVSQYWSSAENLGEDDTIVLVGNGSAVIGLEGDAVSAVITPDYFQWVGGEATEWNENEWTSPALELSYSSLTLERFYGGESTYASWLTSDSGKVSRTVNADVSIDEVYLTELPTSVEDQFNWG